MAHLLSYKRGYTHKNLQSYNIYSTVDFPTLQKAKINILNQICRRNFMNIILTWEVHEVKIVPPLYNLLTDFSFRYTPFFNCFNVSISHPM